MTISKPWAAKGVALYPHPTHSAVRSHKPAFQRPGLRPLSYLHELLGNHGPVFGMGEPH